MFIYIIVKANPNPKGTYFIQALIEHFYQKWHHNDRSLFWGGGVVIINVIQPERNSSSTDSRKCHTSTQSCV